MSGCFSASRSLRLFVCLVLSSFALVGLGCGSKKATVSGKISYKGTPLPSGTVTFFNADKQIVGTGTISNGTYKIADLPVGPVKISVSTPPAPKDDPLHPAPKDMPAGPGGPSIPIPPTYSNPEQSNLTYEVKSGTQEHPIELN